jgi:hypothetical protein
MGFVLSTILCFVMFLPVPAAAEVYKWVDERGQLHATDDLNSIPERYRSQGGAPA